ncbi:hypothetical protein RvY_03380 [Ramazzottius varieornatus]|uniref:Uncharacterized protein n=1 Tax=Ramazzottius varieornatus TaxID=947166 RepID=A0A1D1UNN4_RAMVA|nr:hypothetical protein RvY_03380 [Ramazzottius varieornatus]
MIKRAMLSSTECLPTEHWSAATKFSYCPTTNFLQPFHRGKAIPNFVARRKIGTIFLSQNQSQLTAKHLQKKCCSRPAVCEQPFYEELKERVEKISTPGPDDHTVATGRAKITVHHCTARAV